MASPSQKPRGCRQTIVNIPHELRSPYFLQGSSQVPCGEDQARVDPPEAEGVSHSRGQLGQLLGGVGHVVEVEGWVRIVEVPRGGHRPLRREGHEIRTKSSAGKGGERKGRGTGDSNDHPRTGSPKHGIAVRRGGQRVWKKNVSICMICIYSSSRAPRAGPAQ